MQRYSTVLPWVDSASGRPGARAFARLPAYSQKPFDRTSTDVRFSSCPRTGVL